MAHGICATNSVLSRHLSHEKDFFLENEHLQTLPFKKPLRLERQKETEMSYTQ